jgi:hypothetical protein
MPSMETQVKDSKFNAAHIVRERESYRCATPQSIGPVPCGAV